MRARSSAGERLLHTQEVAGSKPAAPTGKMMARRTTKLFDKVYGWLLGGAIGDAFGIRTEMMHYRDIEAQYGRVSHFDPLPPRKASEEPPMERFQPFGVPMELEGGFHPLGRWSREVGA